MDLDEWYDLVQEPLPSNPPERPWGTWALTAAGVLAVVLLLVGAVLTRGDGNDEKDQFETTESTLSPPTSFSDALKSRVTESTDDSSPTTAPPPTVGGLTIDRSDSGSTASDDDDEPSSRLSPGFPSAPPSTASPSPASPPLFPPATSPPPSSSPSTTRRPAPQPAPPQPTSKSSGDLTVDVHLSRTDPNAGQGVTVSVHYVDAHGSLDIISVDWGDGNFPSEHDEDPCAGLVVGHEEQTVNFIHTYAAAGRYQLRVLVRTNDCAGDFDQVEIKSGVLVR